MLQVFSTSWCGPCKALKIFLKDNNIAFQERDIEQDKEAYAVMDRLQLRSVPVVYFDDDNYVVGLNKNKILELSKK